MGDKIKVEIFLLFLLFLYHNQINWNKAMMEMKYLENKVDNLKQIVAPFLSNAVQKQK